MNSRVGARVVLGAGIALMIAWASAVFGDDTCETVHDGLNVDKADTIEPVYYGRAADQVFTAVGRTIVAVTVWKAPTTGANITRAGLYICEAETLDTGEVRSKAVRGVIRVGPVVEYTSAHDAPVPLRFTLEPPLILPHGGQFGFAVRDEHRCLGIFALMAAAGNQYAGGDMWSTGPHISCAYGPYPGYPLSPVDLAFDIEYCDAVGVEGKTWGEMKDQYRH